MTIRTSLLSACTFAITTLGLSLSASAQLEPAPAGSTLTPAEATAMGGPELTNILLAPGRLDIRVPLAIGLNSGDAGKPISIPVDIYYGLNEDLTIGLSHSNGTVAAVMPYGAGAGLCLSGKDDGGCPKVYDNVGVDALFSLMKGVLQLAAHGGLDIDSIDQSFLSLRLGVLFQAPLATNNAIITDPRLSLGLSKRDEGNEDFLMLPLGVQFWANPGLRLAVRTGLYGYLESFSDNYGGFLGAFAGLSFTPAVEGFASFDFTRMYGNFNTGDIRQLVLGVNFAM
jgi:hypothetical protein